MLDLVIYQGCVFGRLDYADRRFSIGCDEFKYWIRSNFIVAPASCLDEIKLPNLYKAFKSQTASFSNLDNLKISAPLNDHIETWLAGAKILGGSRRVNKELTAGSNGMFQKKKCTIIFEKLISIQFRKLNCRLVDIEVHNCAPLFTHEAFYLFHTRAVKLSRLIARFLIVLTYPKKL